MSAQPEAQGENTAAVSAEVAVQRWTRGTLAPATSPSLRVKPTA